MDSPPSDLQNQVPIRRTTRSALAEIPGRIQTMTVHEVSRINETLNAMGLHGRGGVLLAATPVNPGRPPGLTNVSLNMPSSMMSPSPSPDELMIQARGRRRMPIVWSPDIDNKKSPTGGQANNGRTPVKSPAKSSIVTRSTPRKRLVMYDPKEVLLSPEKRTKSPSTKRVRVESPGSYQGPLDQALKGLSHEQLILVIEQLVSTSPHLAQSVKDALPAPDLRPLEERLKELKKNIFQSLPSSRLTSKTDSPAYNRASVHLSAFKKCVQVQGCRLVECQHWAAVIEYVLMAWAYVKATPLWDNHAHNTVRKQCFKSLAAQLMSAIKRCPFTEQQMRDLETKLEDCRVDNEDIQACLNHLSARRNTAK